MWSKAGADGTRPGRARAAHISASPAIAAMFCSDGKVHILRSHVPVVRVRRLAACMHPAQLPWRNRDDRDARSKMRIASL